MPEKVLVTMVRLPRLKMAPPSESVLPLPEKVLLLTVSAPSLKMPPPALVAELPVTILLLSSSVPVELL